jgi:hypothetical protein
MNTDERPLVRAVPWAAADGAGCRDGDPEAHAGEDIEDGWEVDGDGDPLGSRPVSQEPA